MLRRNILQSICDFRHKGRTEVLKVTFYKTSTWKYGHLNLSKERSAVQKLPNSSNKRRKLIENSQKVTLTFTILLTDRKKLKFANKLTIFKWNEWLFRFLYKNYVLNKIVIILLLKKCLFSFQIWQFLQINPIFLLTIFTRKRKSTHLNVAINKFWG